MQRDRKNHLLIFEEVFFVQSGQGDNFSTLLFGVSFLNRCPQKTKIIVHNIRVWRSLWVFNVVKKWTNLDGWRRSLATDEVISKFVLCLLSFTWVLSDCVRRVFSLDLGYEVSSDRTFNFFCFLLKLPLYCEKISHNARISRSSESNEEFGRAKCNERTC